MLAYVSAVLFYACGASMLIWPAYPSQLMILVVTKKHCTEVALLFEAQ